MKKNERNKKFFGQRKSLIDIITVKLSKEKREGNPDGKEKKKSKEKRAATRRRKTTRKSTRKKARKGKVRRKKKATRRKKKKATRKKARRPAKRKAAKKKKKAKKKSRKKRKPNAAFMKKLTPSKALAAVVGSSALPRTEVTKKLWAYIKRHKLQDPKNRRNVRTGADEKLKAIFKKPVVTMFEIPKILSKHLS